MQSEQSQVGLCDRQLQNPVEEVFSRNFDVDPGSTFAVSNLSNQESRPPSDIVNSMWECQGDSQEDFVSSYVAVTETVVTSDAASRSCQEGTIPSCVAGIQEVDITSSVGRLYERNSEFQLQNGNI